MTRTVVLDTGPLGLLTAPPRRPAVRACSHWLADLVAAGVRIVIPELADYELRRELLRAGKKASVQRLEALALATEYLPITTAVMRRAAERPNFGPRREPEGSPRQGTTRSTQT